MAANREERSTQRQVRTEAAVFHEVESVEDEYDLYLQAALKESLETVQDATEGATDNAADNSTDDGTEMNETERVRHYRKKLKELQKEYRGPKTRNFSSEQKYQNEEMAHQRIQTTNWKIFERH